MSLPPQWDKMSCSFSNSYFYRFMYFTFFMLWVPHLLCNFPPFLDLHGWILPLKKVQEAIWVGQQNSSGFGGITAHERGFGATPLVPKANVQRMGPSSMQLCMQNITSQFLPPASLSPRGAKRGDPNVSVTLTVVGLRCSLTCRLTGYHGVGHGCGPGKQFTQ